MTGWVHWPDVGEVIWRGGLEGLGQPKGGGEMFGLVAVQRPVPVGRVPPYVTGHVD